MYLGISFHDKAAEFGLCNLMKAESSLIFENSVRYDIFVDTCLQTLNQCGVT